MTTRKGLLVRVGIDQTFGGYNAPINPETNEFLYMPIPQSGDKFRIGMGTSYSDLLPYLDDWCQKNDTEITLPHNLNTEGTHLDPDFDFSTYGDQATGRGLRVGDLKTGDFLAFFASFKPVSKCDHNLIYALFGLMVVDRVLRVADVPEEVLHKNAHTRVSNMNKEHWVVFADPTESGRFRKAIPIGEFRDGSYRVKNSILDKWGDIGVKNGFIQRSVCPPWFNKPEQFLKWIEYQQVQLINSNWE